MLNCKPAYFLGKYLCVFCVLFFALSKIKAFASPAGKRPHKQPTANQIINLTFSYPTHNQLYISHFLADIYYKSILQTKRKNELLRFLPGHFNLEPGEKHYFSEMLLKYQFHYPNKIDKKIIAYHSSIPDIFKLPRKLQDNTLITPYGATIWNNWGLSPFFRENQKHYQYTLDTLLSEKNTILAKIKITPYYKNTQLLSGYAWINAHTGQIKKAFLEGIYNMIHIHCRIIMGEKGTYSLLPKSIYSNLSYTLLGNKLNLDLQAHFNFTKVDTFSYPTKSLFKNNSLDESQYYDLTLDTLAIIREKSFFDSIRPTPLTPKELTHSIIPPKQSATLYHPNPSLGRRLEKIFFDVHRLNFKHGTIKFPPLLDIEMVNYSQSEGLSLQNKIHINKKNKVYIKPELGYFSKEKEWLAYFPMRWNMKEAKNLNLQIEFGKLKNIYNDKQFNEQISKLNARERYDSILSKIRKKEYEMYQNYFAKIAIQGNIFPGLSLLGAVSFYHYPLKYSPTTKLLKFKEVHNSLSFKINAIYTPNLHYYKQKDYAHPTYSTWPTFALSYEHSLPYLYLHANFSKLEFNNSLIYPFGGLRSLYYRFNVGFFIKKEESYFINYEFFNNNNLNNQLQDKMMGRFHILSGHWYNNSPYYCAMYTAYESPTLFVSKLKGLTNFIQKERLYANLLFTSLLYPYVELGYGFSTHLGSLGLFISTSNTRYFNAGFAFTFNLFDNW